MKLFLSLILFAFFAVPNDVWSQPYVSYETRSYTGSKGLLNDMQSTSRFLSHGDGLLEFRLKNSFLDSLTPTGERKTYKVLYDTIACYYLDLRTTRYFEIDCFSVKHKIIGTGRFSDKPSGVPITNDPKFLDHDMIPNSVRDTVVEGKLCKAADFTGESTPAIGPQKMIVIFRNDLQFNSIFACTSFLEQHLDWIPVSYFVVAVNFGDAYMIRIENLNESDKSARQIFDAIRKTVDTFKAKG